MDKTADKHDTYSVIQAVYQLALEYTRRVSKFPRDNRFVLGDRILQNCYNILEGLVEARYSRVDHRGRLLREQ